MDPPYMLLLGAPTVPRAATHPRRRVVCPRRRVPTHGAAASVLPLHLTPAWKHSTRRQDGEKTCSNRLIFYLSFSFIFSQSPITSPQSPIERGDRRVSLSLFSIASLPAVSSRKKFPPLPLFRRSPRLLFRWPPTSTRPTSSRQPPPASSPSYGTHASVETAAHGIHYWGRRGGALA